MTGALYGAAALALCSACYTELHVPVSTVAAYGLSLAAIGINLFRRPGAAPQSPPLIESPHLHFSDLDVAEGPVGLDALPQPAPFVPPVVETPARPVVDEASIAHDPLSISFDREPVFRLPSRRIGFVYGKLAEHPSLDDLSLLEYSNLTLAKALDYLLTNPASSGKSVLCWSSNEWIEDVGSVESLIEVIAAHPEIKDRLILELGETSLLDRSQYAAVHIAVLIAAGVRFALKIGRGLSVVDLGVLAAGLKDFAFLVAAPQTFEGMADDVVALLRKLDIAFVALGVTAPDDILELMDRGVTYAAGSALKPASSALSLPAAASSPERKSKVPSRSNSQRATQAAAPRRKAATTAVADRASTPSSAVVTPPTRRKAKASSAGQSAASAKRRTARKSV